MDEVIFASSYDEKHPPENIFTNKNNEFFSSTGMFPQQICIQLNALKSIKTIELITYGIKRIEIQSSENDSAVNFKKQAEQNEIPQSNGLQKISLNLTQNPKIKVLKIEILEGYEDFCTIHSIKYK